jgi:hypothetical protein
MASSLGKIMPETGLGITHLPKAHIYAPNVCGTEYKLMRPITSVKRVPWVEHVVPPIHRSEGTVSSIAPNVCGLRRLSSLFVH